SVRCVRVFGHCETFCYGPEVGRSTFSVWAKGNPGNTFWISYQIMDFDWNLIGEGWSPIFTLGDSWTRVDTTLWAGATMTLGPEADRVEIRLLTAPSDTVLFAYPQLMVVGEAGVPDHGTKHDGPLVLSGNPVLRGTPLRVAQASVALYDVTGRRLSAACTPSGDGTYGIPTSGLAPGIYFLVPEGLPSGPRAACAATKLVLLQ
ncbi:MAG TPA: hypothetical protein VMU02_11400, partial [bacterium]|nr:hypothetical protein [bacterium]